MSGLDLSNGCPGDPVLDGPLFLPFAMIWSDHVTVLACLNLGQSDQPLAYE